MFEGFISILAVFEDNSLVRSRLEQPARSRSGILVIDGSGSRRCALLGGGLGTLAVESG